MQIDDIAEVRNLHGAVRFVLHDKEDEAMIDPLRDIPFLENLDARLTDLSQRLKSGQYEPRRVAIVELPKGDFTTRPLSHLSMDDWVVAQATLNVVADTLDRGQTTRGADENIRHTLADASAVINKVHVEQSIVR